MDAVSAYLNTEVHKNELIYIRQPPGLEKKGEETKVGLLLKTGYGLKQADKRWYKHLVHALVVIIGLHRCDVDRGVFFKHFDDGSLAILLVHVDNFTVVGSVEDRLM